jgi:type I site-specific restriction endonuclease
MNQNPEQLARDEIDRQLIASGWKIDRQTFILHL